MTDFGKDTYCLDSLKTGRYASGLRLLGQRCYRRLITPRGMLLGGDDEKNFGYDLAQFCGATLSDELAAQVGPQIQNELLKEEEVEEVTVDLVSTDENNEITWTITIDVESARGPFKLVLAVGETSVELLNLEAA